MVQLELARPPAAASNGTTAAPEHSDVAGTLTFVKSAKMLLVSCRDGGALEVARVKPAGGKWAPGREWWNGVGGKGGVRTLA